MRGSFKGVAALFFFGVLLVGQACYAETVRIIAEDDWYPYSAKNDGGPQGIGVDIVRAAFQAEGVEVEFDVMNYDRGMELVREGKSVGCFDAPRTSEIEEVYLWHDKPLFSAVGLFYAVSSFQGRINGLEDVVGKKVGFTQGYGYGNAVDLDTGMIKEYSINDKTLIRKLLAKRLDFIVLFDKVADYLLPQQGAGGQVEPVGNAGTIDIYLAFSRNHLDGKRFRDVFSRGMSKIEADGSYQKIMSEWDTRLKRTERE